MTVDGTTKDSVQFSTDDFLFAESNGNYVEVYTLCDGRVKKNAVRCTIRS
jgi:hypothetical protein